MEVSVLSNFQRIPTRLNQCISHNQMPLTQDLYAIANAPDRELLPIPRVTLPKQKSRKRSLLQVGGNNNSPKHPLLTGFSETNPTSNNNSTHSQTHAQKHSSTTATPSQEDAHWLRNLGMGEFVPPSRESKRQERIDQEEKGERLLVAINRMEKYLTRDIMLQELMSKDNVESAAADVSTFSHSNSNLPLTDATSPANRIIQNNSNNTTGSINSKNQTTTNVVNHLIYKQLNNTIHTDMSSATPSEKTWLEKEKERLILLAMSNDTMSQVVTNGGSALTFHPNISNTNLNSSSLSSFSTMTSKQRQHHDNDITSSLGLPLLPSTHRSTQSKPTLIGASEVNMSNLPKPIYKRKGEHDLVNRGTLPDSFTMPESMRNAVSNVPPFRNKLNRTGLKRGDWVLESELLMTEERKKSIQLASANVQPPFWNEKDTTTVVQYNRNGMKSTTNCNIKYDYIYESEHAALVIQAALRGHMARLDIYKPWGARDRWMAVKIQRNYRMFMCRKEYVLLKLVLNMQGTYRDPYCRTIQRVYRGILGRRRHQARKIRLYPSLIQIQTQWRMMVARERCKFRREIRNKWKARDIQRIWRGHWGKQLFRKKKFVLSAEKRYERDPSCIWGLIQLAMRLNQVKHNWKKLPKGYLSDHSLGAWHKVARKPRLESEGIEGTLLSKISKSTNTRLFSHALYLLKQDRDTYCIGLFPSKISATSYVLKLETSLPTGRGHVLSHFFVCSIFQLGSSQLINNINKKKKIKNKTTATSPKKTKTTSSLSTTSTASTASTISNSSTTPNTSNTSNNATATPTKTNCTFVIEAFEPDTDRECIPYIISENILLNASNHSNYGKEMMEGGRRIIDLRPWIIQNLKLVKTASARSNHILMKGQMEHGVRIISPIVERARRRTFVETACKLLQRKIRGRGGNHGFAIVQARQREKMRQVASAMMRRKVRNDIRLGRLEACTDVQRCWRGYLRRKDTYFYIDRLLNQYLMRPITKFTEKEVQAQKIAEKKLIEKLKNDPKRRKWGKPTEEEEKDKKQKEKLLSQETDLSIVYFNKKMRIGGGLPLHGRTATNLIDTMTTSSNSNNKKEGKYMMTTVRQVGTCFEIEASEIDEGEDKGEDKGEGKGEDKGDGGDRKKTHHAHREHEYRGSITFFEIIQLVQKCPLLNMTRMNKKVLILRLLTLCELRINTVNGAEEEEKGKKRSQQHLNKQKRIQRRPNSGGSRSTLICSHGRDRHTCR